MSFEETIRNEYFEWLYNYVCEGRVHDKISYKKLFRLLHDIEFEFYIRNDLNRAKDGVDLRYRFAMLKDGDEIEIVEILNKPCSVLEMMIALAIRCEESIMDDTRYGDRTSQWFWSMLSNLGIGYMTDERFNEDDAVEKIYRFIEKRYRPDGKGGLFHIKGYDGDLRDLEIWTQLCLYLKRFE